MAAWKEINKFDHPNVSAFVKMFQRVYISVVLNSNDINSLVMNLLFNSLSSDFHHERGKISSLGAFFCYKMLNLQSFSN